MRPSLRMAVLVGLSGVAAPAIAFTTVMGYAHTKAGRPLLAKLVPVLHAAGIKGPSCPLGYDVAMTPEQKESLRQAFALTHRGAAVAGERPALGFALDKTTSADVLAWAAEKHVQCVRPKTGYDIDCSNVAAAALPGASFVDPLAPPVSSMWLTFGTGDRLIAVIALRRDSHADAITHAFVTVGEELAADGPASATTGDATPAYLSVGALRQASAEYRFQNYYVMTRATNMGADFLMSEEYRSL